MNTVSNRLGLSGVLALRAQILERSRTLGQVAGAIGQPAGVKPAEGGFISTMAQALKAVNSLEVDARHSAAAYERGETQDIASVVLARQKASIAFEATLQARNRLLSAYRDIMNMPV